MTGNFTNHFDTAGRKTVFTYLPSRRLSSMTRGSGAETATIGFGYDPQFNSLGVTDALNRDVESYILDIQDRPVSVQNVESQTMSISYSVGDIVTSVTRFDGSTVSNEYDVSARLTGVFWPSVSNLFSYYDNALLQIAANEAGSLHNLYDEADRLAQVQFSGSSPQTFTVSYGYDAVGQVTNHHSLAGDVATVFDAAERIGRVEGDYATFEFAYGANNGLIAAMTNQESGVHAEYLFDDRDRLTDIVWRTSSNTVLRSFAYSFDDAGMITNLERETSAEDVAYTYDSLDRLKSVNASYHTATYGWDLAGNPTSRVENTTNTTFTLGTGNRLASWAGGSFKHDDAGCVTNIAAAGVTKHLVWGDRYQLVSVSSNATLQETYTYDALGRRVSVTDGSTTNWFIYDGLHITAETDGDGNLTKSYVYGPGIDNLLSMTVYSASETNTYTMLTDHQGTVHAVTDENGDIVESYRYDPWGQVLGVWDETGSLISESGIGNRFLFQGREYSWETGFYYFRARWYDPGTGRWLSKDPIGINGGLNQYVAFNNSPTKFIDPLGLANLDAAIGMMGETPEDRQRNAAIQTAGLQGAVAFVDGVVPVFDPAAALGAYDASDPTFDVSQLSGAITRDVITLLSGGALGTALKAEGFSLTVGQRLMLGELGPTWGKLFFSKNPLSPSSLGADYLLKLLGRSLLSKIENEALFFSIIS